MKKWSGDISKLYLHTEFQENRLIRLVSSDQHRQTDTQTDTHTYGQTFFVNHFFGLRGPQNG